MTYKEAREKANLSMANAAAQIGVNRAAVWAWENGVNNPLLDNIKKMAEVYGVSVAELMEDTKKVV